MAYSILKSVLINVWPTTFWLLSPYDDNDDDDNYDDDDSTNLKIVQLKDETPPQVQVENHFNPSEHKIEKIMSRIESLNTRVTELEKESDSRNLHSIDPNNIEKLNLGMMECSNIKELCNRFIPSETNNNLYKTQKKKGLCRAFIHQKFDNKCNKERWCAADEAKIIKETFKDYLGLDLTIFKDREKAQIEMILTDLVNVNYTDIDYVCIIIATHGTDDGFIHAKDHMYNTNVIINILSNLPSRVTKIIMIQACRGDKVDKGDKVDTGIVDGETVDENKNIKLVRGPKMLNFFIGYSSFEGFVSFKNLFLPIMCEMIVKLHNTHDIDAIFYKITQKVSKIKCDIENSMYEGGMQAVAVTKSLSDFFYF